MVGRMQSTCKKRKGCCIVECTRATWQHPAVCCPTHAQGTTAPDGLRQGARPTPLPHPLEAAARPAKHLDVLRRRGLARGRALDGTDARQSRGPNRLVRDVLGGAAGGAVGGHVGHCGGGGGGRGAAVGWGERGFATATRQKSKAPRPTAGTPPPRAAQPRWPPRHVQYCTVLQQAHAPPAAGGAPTCHGCHHKEPAAGEGRQGVLDEAAGLHGRQPPALLLLLLQPG